MNAYVDAAERLDYPAELVQLQTEEDRVRALCTLASPRRRACLQQRVIEAQHAAGRASRDLRRDERQRGLPPAQTPARRRRVRVPRAALTATIALFGNDPPQCPKADRALSDSMIALHMPSKGVFGVPDPDPQKLQFQIDPDIIKKLKSTGIQVAMVRELSDHLSAYIARGRKHPDEKSEYDFTGYMLNVESKTIEDHVWSVVTKEGAGPTDSIKTLELYDAVRSNGYMQTQTKFTRDTLFLRTDPQIGVVKHGNQNVYKGLKRIDTATSFTGFDQQF
jgi:hypothetical protein